MEIGKSFEEKTAELIGGFTKRNPKLKEIQAAGYDEVQTDNGSGFINWDLKPFNPTKDLRNLAIEIANLIEKDKYLTGTIAAATEIPLIWLSTQNTNKIQKAFELAQGFVSVSARLKTDEHPKADSQMLQIFVGQMQNENDALLLKKRTEEINPDGFCEVGIAKADLFAIVVARSFMFGIESFETKDKLGSLPNRYWNYWINLSRK